MTSVERVIAAAKAEVGYLEKASNSQLDSKTANVGDKNYTKYARDLDNLNVVYNGKKNGYAWCDVFVDWCFITTFGLDLGMKLLCQPYSGAGAGCTYSMGYYKTKGQFYTSNPKAGDQIFFTSDGGKTSYHTGLVVDVKNGYVYTIEGNTSSTAGVVANGGCVATKSYKLTASYIAGYGRPNYSLVPEESDNKEEDIMTGSEIIAALSDEDAYKLLTKAQSYAAALPEPAWSRLEGHWQRLTADGTINGGSPEGIIKRDEVIAILGRKGLL